MLSIRKVTFIDDELRILLTGYADLNAVMDSVNEGEIYRYITKPWQNDELKKIVNKATEIAQQTQEITQNTMENDATQNRVNSGTVSNRNILVLDDDESVYQQIKSHFKSAYTVSWASNIGQAAKLLQKNALVSRLQIRRSIKKILLLLFML